ncbi:hypothetical protein TNCV_3218441 [Trichonephila clavipes]|nr:hypothetical protein TNCV_3218441 [Trichonephila clavipes]
MSNQGRGEPLGQLNLVLKRPLGDTVGCGSPVVKVSNHGRHGMSSSPVPLKTRRVGQRCTLNLSRAETSSVAKSLNPRPPLQNDFIKRNRLRVRSFFTEPPLPSSGHSLRPPFTVTKTPPDQEGRERFIPLFEEEVEIPTRQMGFRLPCLPENWRIERKPLTPTFTFPDGLCSF